MLSSSHLPSPLSAQDVRPKDVREIGKGGSVALPRLGELLKERDTAVRVEAVKQITDIGTLASLDLLIQATHDNDPEVQMRAVDGLVNFYLPGYVRTGIAASITRVGGSIKSRFTDTNDQVVDPVYYGAAGCGRGDRRRWCAAATGWTCAPAPHERRAFCAARARSRDLLEALRTKNTDVLYESLIALQKIHDESAGPRMTFLLRDPEPKVQIAAHRDHGAAADEGGGAGPDRRSEARQER